MAKPQGWGENDQPVSYGGGYGANDTPVGADIPPNPSDNIPTGQAPNVPGLKKDFLSPVQKLASEHPYATAAATTLFPSLSPIVDPNAEVQRGMVKQLGRDAYGLVTGPGAGPIGMAAGYGARKLGITPKVEAATAPSNDMQRGGGYAAMAGEAALPMPPLARGLPSAERAGAGLARARLAGAQIPVDLSGASVPALRAQELATRGGTPPKVINDFLQRIPVHHSEPMMFPEARDFYSQGQRLAFDEARNLKGTPMGHELGELVKSLGTANQEAATRGGFGPEFAGHMKEYAQAKGLQKVGDVAKKAAIGVGLGGGAIGGGRRIARNYLEK